MKKRQIIIVLSTIAILFAGFGGFKLLSSLKEAPARKKQEKTFRLVKVKKVELDTITKKIPVNGKIIAKDKIEVFPEVGGTLLSSSKPFKVGQRFNKGEVLLMLDGSESLLNLKSQRSNFASLVTNLLPDIKIDYPDQFDAWKSYLANIYPEKALPEIPEIKDEKLKNFLSGRNFYQQYYAIKSLENRQSKFTITAPFDGVVSMGNVNPGTLLRVGQKVGEFISINTFEFETAIAAKDASEINIGDSIRLSAEDENQRFNARVNRISASIDPSNQRVSVYAGLSDPKLKEGMYLEGTISTTQVSNAFRLDRNLIKDGSVFIVQDTALTKKPVEIKHKFKQDVIVSGLSSGDLLLDQVIEGAYEGMPVKTENR